MSVASVLAAKLAGVQQIVKAFRAGRAVNPAAARPLRDLGLNDSTALRQMVAATIIVRVGTSRYYLDETVWASRRRLSAATVVRTLVIIGIIAAALAVYFIGR
jgi:hypothetical protein